MCAISPIALPLENSLSSLDLEERVEFLPFGHQLLREPTMEVQENEICSPKIQKIIDRLLLKAKQESSLVGLAAPQIGERYSILIIALHVDKGEARKVSNFKAYINPCITYSSPELEEDIESCVSVDSRICGIVPRAARITIKAFDREGNCKEEEFTGFTARIFQHAIDHLHGKRFPDLVENPLHLHWVEPTEIEEYQIRWSSWKKLIFKTIWDVVIKGADKITSAKDAMVFCIPNGLLPEKKGSSHV